LPLQNRTVPLLLITIATIRFTSERAPVALYIRRRGGSLVTGFYSNFDRWSLALDLKILLRAFPPSLRDRERSEIPSATAPIIRSTYFAKMSNSRFTSSPG
jgi:hypothetical protein